MELELATLLFSNLEATKEQLKTFQNEDNNSTETEDEEPSHVETNISAKERIRRRKTALSTAKTKKYQVKVYVHAQILKLGEIDTLNEKFHAEVLIRSSWREPMLDGTSTNTHYTYATWDEGWNPELCLVNGFGEVKEKITYIVVYDALGRAVVEERRQVKGNFAETLELFDFPFDTQELSVQLSTLRTEEEVSLNEHPNLMSSVNADAFTDRQQWKLYNKVKINKSVKTDVFADNKTSEKTDTRKETLSISSKVKRLSNFFWWNVILIMVFIGSLVFCTFVVPITKVESRLSVSFLLLLSIVTFKFTVNKMIPKVPYLTYLDKYMLLTIFLLCFVPVWHSIISTVNNIAAYSPVAVKFDTAALVILIILYVTFNVTFITLSQFTAAKKEKRKKKEQEKKAL